MTLIVKTNFCLGNEDEHQLPIVKFECHKCPNAMAQERFYRHLFFQEQLTIGIQST